MVGIMDITVEIEKPDGNLYYPKIPEITINKADPYQVDSANIRIAEIFSDISNISIHDQVKIILDDITYFAGHLGKRKFISSIDDSSLEFPAKDYGGALGYTYISTLKNWTSSTAIGTIIENLRSSFVSSYLTGNNIATGPNIASYNVPAWGKTLLQSYQELVKIANYDLFVDTDGDINFITKQTTAIDGFEVVEGKNIMEINSYTEDVEGVRNYVKVIGDTGYSAFAQDTTSQGKYHKREYLHTDPSLGSNAACQAMADALIQAEPPISISLTLTGDLNVNPRDFVNTYIPSYGIDTSYKVTKVEQMIDVNTFETSLELGSHIQDITSIIAQIRGELSYVQGAYV